MQSRPPISDICKVWTKISSRPSEVMVVVVRMDPKTNKPIVLMGSQCPCHKPIHSNGAMT